MISPKSSLLNKHTLHIPIRNRPKWLEYTLSLYKMYNYSGAILIADDSDQLIYEKNIHIINNFKYDLKINHFRSKSNFFEEQNRRYNFTKYFSYKEIDTEYYSCTSDDDLFYVDFAYDAINFLDKNNDYSAVTGADMKIYFDEDFNIKNTYTKWWPDSHHEDSLDRLMDYTHNPSAAYLGVCRTSALKDIFELEKEKKTFCFVREINDPGLADFDMEIPWMVQLYISGKIGRIDNKLNSFRGEHAAEDRQTLNYLAKQSKNNKSKIYGSIIPTLNNTFGISVKKTYEDFYFLIMKNSKYEKNVVEDVLLRVLWKIITKIDYFHVSNGETIFGKKYLSDLRLSKILTLRLVKIKNNSILVWVKFFLKQIQRKIINLTWGFNRIKFNKIKREHFKKHQKIRNILNN